MSQENEYHRKEFEREAFTLFLHYSASAKVGKLMAQNLIDLVLENSLIDKEQMVYYCENGTAGIKRLNEERLDENFKNLSLAEMCVVLKQMYKLD